MEPRQPLAVRDAHCLLGRLHTEAGCRDDAAMHLEAALAQADACAAPCERALTLPAQADPHMATENNAGAQTPLDEVRAICTPLGARPALARVDALATRLESGPAPSPHYPAGLTAREVEVPRLVATGPSNAKVAAHLNLSPRTVEQHVHSTFNKLDVSSRVAASRFAIEHRLARGCSAVGLLCRNRAAVRGGARPMPRCPFKLRAQEASFVRSECIL